MKLNLIAFIAVATWITGTVVGASYLPDIEKEPRSQELELELEADGPGHIVYQWFKNAVAIPGADDDEIEIDEVTMADGGVYACRVTNEHGSVWTRAVEVRVIPFEFDQHPKRESTDIGRDAEFEVEVDGDGPFAFQWYHDGKRIPGATDAMR